MRCAESDSVRSWPTALRQVTADEMREYAHAVGERSEVHYDRDAAVRAGFRGLVAPPMFVAVYAGQPVIAATKDPAVFPADALLVHAAQEFEWEEPVCEGDRIHTRTSLGEVREIRSGTMYSFLTDSTNQFGQITARGRWRILRR